MPSTPWRSSALDLDRLWAAALLGGQGTEGSGLGAGLQCHTEQELHVRTKQPAARDSRQGSGSISRQQSPEIDAALRPSVCPLTLYPRACLSSCLPDGFP